jgi:hypothetical protein
MSGMKKSTIKLVLQNKIKDWLLTVPDTKVSEAIERDVIVSGGAIASMLSGEKVNDFDLYFKTYETAKLVAEYYITIFNNTKGELKSKAIASCNPQLREEVRKNIKGVEEKRIIVYMKSAGIAAENQSEYRYFEGEDETASDEFIESLGQENPLDDSDPLELAQETSELVKDKKAKYRPVFFSENAVTLSNKIQLVTRFHGDPAQIHENYDFVHSMCHYDFQANDLVLHSEALEAILSKTLIYRGSLYPVASVFRTRKFINRGWRITAGQLLKILMQISSVDLKDPKILREQLIGVDQAYMHQLLRALESSDAARVDITYLAKLVDEIFE